MQKLEQKVAPDNEASEKSPVDICIPHYPQHVYRQSYRPNYCPQYQNYQPKYRHYHPNYRQFQPNYQPHQQYAPVVKIILILN